MYKVSILISISENENQLEKCLDSLKNQTLKDIEILIISNLDKFSLNYNEINKFDSIEHAITQINGEYVLFINEYDYIQKEACELLYNHAKNEELDIIYIPITDKNIKKDNFTIFDKQTSIKSQFKFAQFCKKSCLDDFKWNNNLFYEIPANPEKTDFIKQEIYFRSNISKDNIEKYTAEFLKIFPDETDILFSILFEYLIAYPLNLKHDFYDIIKYYFKNYNLNKKNREIYKLILNNDNLIDFLTEYKLNTIEYEIYKNPISNNNNYKISVIIPIFNNAILIHRTLMSIENQSFGIDNIEVLMVNDASKDNTKNVINQYVDKYPNFKAIHIKKGTGSAGTPRNLGLQLALGDYVIFLDHDDFFEINALEKLYNKIIEYNCDVVYGTYVLINSKESIKFTYPNEKHAFFRNLEDNKRSITTPPSIWTKLFKKEFLINNKILFPTILGEDIIFLAKALKNANGIYYLWNDIICYYNLNESSYSTNLSYDYFVEGFTSEEYLYNLFNDWEQIEYYKIRGQGILDFYINRVRYSNLSNEDIANIFPLLYRFCNRLDKLNVNPKLEKNKKAFEYIINYDLNGFLKLKNYKPHKIKVFSNKILNKINKHGFW